MKTKQILILTGVVIGGAALLHFIILKKTTLGSTGPSGAPPPPLAGATLTGNQAYSSQAGAKIRSGPQTSDGFLWFGGNVISTISSAGTWLGTYTGQQAPDMDQALNPLTGAVYNWYCIKIGSTISTSTLLGYVREDYITIK